MLIPEAEWCARVTDFQRVSVLPVNPSTSSPVNTGLPLKVRSIFGREDLLWPGLWAPAGLPRHLSVPVVGSCRTGTVGTPLGVLQVPLLVRPLLVLKGKVVKSHCCVHELGV